MKRKGRTSQRTILFRHTLIVLCKHEHRDVTKPWRRGLAEKLCASLHLTLRSRSDALVDAAKNKNARDQSGRSCFCLATPY